MQKSSMHLLPLLCAGFLAAAASSVGAQSVAGYPSKPVRIINPYAAGGASDAVARTVANGLTKTFGQSFVVDNRAGGDTVIGVNAVARAAPDGYTLLVTTESFLANHWMMSDLPYDSVKDFALITPLVHNESVLTAHPSVPAKNLNEFIAYAKANPGKLNVAVSSAVGVLSATRFMNETGIKLTVVNYKGGAPATTDLLAGNVQVVIFSVLAVQPLINAGKLRGFAVSGAKRDSGLPDVPTFDEGGLIGFDPAGPLQYPLLTPSKTSRDIVERLNVQARRALADPEIVGQLNKLSFSPVPMTVAEAEKLFRTELERYGKLVRDAGLIKPGAN